MSRFEDLYEDFNPTLRRVIYRILGSESAAEDVCQEAFIRYYERQDALPHDERAKFWLIRVAKNLAFNYEKRRGREMKANETLRHEYQNVENEGEKTTLVEETKQTVRDALAALPFKLRSVLVMKEYANLSYKEIGASLGISENNVKIRVFRARERLAKELNREDLYVPR